MSLSLQTNKDKSPSNYHNQLSQYVQNGQLCTPEQYSHQEQLKYQSPQQLKQIMKNKILIEKQRSKKIIHPQSLSRTSKSQSVTQVVKIKNNKVTNQTKHKNRQTEANQQVFSFNFSPQKLVQDRYTSFQQAMTKNIQSLEGECEKLYGGAQFIMKELDRHEMTREDLVEYYAKMVSKNFQLPKIKSKSTLNLNNFNLIKQKKQSKQKQKLRFHQLVDKKIQDLQLSKKQRLKQRQRQNSDANKWYINPNQRFKVQKNDTKYDWKKQQGILNVIKTRNKTISNRYKFLPNLVQEVKKKYNRDPIFCKYTSIE